MLIRWFWLSSCRFGKTAVVESGSRSGCDAVRCSVMMSPRVAGRGVPGLLIWDSRRWETAIEHGTKEGTRHNR